MSKSGFLIGTTPEDIEDIDGYYVACSGDPAHDEFIPVKQMPRDWPQDDAKTCLGRCAVCGQGRWVQTLPDPFLAEVHPHEPNPPRPLCWPCWKASNDET